MKIKGLPTGFVLPARPVLASKPPSGTNWAHEIKHDGTESLAICQQCRHERAMSKDE
jgi:hypothetical protein